MRRSSRNMSIPNNLLYVTQQLKDFETNQICVFPESGDLNSYGTHSQIRFRLPNSAILNLDSLFISFQAKPAIGSDPDPENFRLPNDLHTLIDRVDVFSGGEQLGHSCSAYNRFKKGYDFISGRTPESDSHPSIVRKATGVTYNGDGSMDANFSEEDLNQSFVWSKFGGFLESATPRFCDASIMNDLELVITLAGNVCFKAQNLESPQTFVSELAAEEDKKGFIVSSLKLFVDAVTFSSGVYDNYISSVMAKRGFVDIGFTSMRHFYNGDFTNEINFNVSSRSVDKIHFQTSDKDTRAISTKSQVHLDHLGQFSKKVDINNYVPPPPATTYKFKLGTIERPPNTIGGDNLGYGASIAISTENTTFADGVVNRVPAGALFTVVAKPIQPLIAGPIEYKGGEGGDFTGGLSMPDLEGPPDDYFIVAAAAHSYANGTASGKGTGAILAIKTGGAQANRVEDVKIHSSGTDFQVGNTITLKFADDPTIQSGTDLVFTIREEMIQSRLTSLECTAGGDNFAAGDHVNLKISAQKTGASDYSFIVAADMLEENTPPSLFATSDPAPISVLLQDDTRVAAGVEKYVTTDELSSFGGTFPITNFSNYNSINFQTQMHGILMPTRPLTPVELYRSTVNAFAEHREPWSPSPDYSRWLSVCNHCCIRLNRQGSTPAFASGIDTMNSGLESQIIANGITTPCVMDAWIECSSIARVTPGKNVEVMM